MQLTEYCNSNSASYCPDTYQFGLKITGFSNRVNTLAGTDIVFFKTLTSDLLSNIESSVNALLPNNDLIPTVAVVNQLYSLSSTYVGMTTKATFTFNVASTFGVDDYLSIAFSTPIFWTTTTSLTCSVGSTTMK